MNIVNEQIQHIVFGEGTVISHENGRLSIQFPEQYGIKQFLYPDAFEKYLKLYNSDLQLSVMEELYDKQAQVEAERLRKQQEQEEANRIIELERSKQAALKRKSASKNKIPKLKSKRNSAVSETSGDNNN